MTFKTFYFLIEYWIIRSLGFFLTLLPLKTLLKLAHPIGFVLYHVLPRQRQIALENLKRAFLNEKDEPELRRIAKGSFVYLVEIAFEWFYLPKLAKHHDRYFFMANPEIMADASRNGRGIIALVSHCGNWEIMALIGGFLCRDLLHIPVSAVARPLKNPFLYHYIKRVRGIFGLQCIDKAGAVREGMRQLKRNGMICILIDQRVREGNVQADLFGQPALTTGFPALMALRYDTPVVHVFLDRSEDLRYVMTFVGPVHVERTLDMERDIKENTESFNKRIEDEIRKDPRRWLWMHRRWRL